MSPSSADHRKKTTRWLIGGSVFVSAVLTVIIAATAAQLDHFEIIGKTVPFAYPWRLVESSEAARLSAWAGYLVHNALVWGLIFWARKNRPRYSDNLRALNWALIGIHILFSGLHIVQTQLWYDGLARDVPEITALGSVALMLILVLVVEHPRRGLFFGKKLPFHKAFIKTVRNYHGYLFSWAIIYDYWYHPTVDTFGHLVGFFYNFLILAQSALIFTRTHLNKWWTFSLEVFVLFHAVGVAIFQGHDMWPMFAFGFGAMVVLTQMHGLGLTTWQKRATAAFFVVAMVVTYAAMGRLAEMHEALRIPLIDYLAVALLYGLFMAGHGTLAFVRKARGKRA
jgi:hypothetical protein